MRAIDLMAEWEKTKQNKKKTDSLNSASSTEKIFPAVALFCRAFQQKQ